MSIENAKKFILKATTAKSDPNFSNIFKNIDSKFESKTIKLEYISTQAKKLGFDFSPQELEEAFIEIKEIINKTDILNIKDRVPTNTQKNNSFNLSKNFWNSLW